MDMQQEPKERFLLFEDRIHQSVNQKLPPLHSEYDHCFWSDWIVLVKDISNTYEFWKFNAVDLLMNESRPIQFRKTETENRIHRTKIYPLSIDFGIIVEMSVGVQYVNFVKLDWNKSEFELINHFQIQAGFLWILVDKMHPSKFVMKWTQDSIIGDYQVCKLVGGKIQRDNSFRSQNSYTFYSQDKFFQFKYSESQITIVDLVSNQQQTFQIDKSHLPQGAQLCAYFDWVNDRLFMDVKFRNIQNSYGVAWADLKTKRWTLFDFQPNFAIRNLAFSDNNLIVVTRIEKYQNDMVDSAMKIYSIPMMRPNSLRRSSWLLLLRIMKQKGEKNPVEAANEYLPLNSDLRSPWFKDEEPIDESIKKLSI